MSRRILFATAIVATVTLTVGIVTAILVRERVRNSAAEELHRQTVVTATLIEEDLGEVDFRPGANPAGQLARLRSQLLRSLERARVVGGHDIVEAVLTVRGRQIPISEPLVLAPVIPSDTMEGDVVSVTVEGVPMLVGVERAELGDVDLLVAVARSAPLLPGRQIMWALVLTLTVGAVLTIALGLWFSQSLSNRLSDIESMARRVGDGDLAVRANTEGGDEIAQVAVAFNTMAEDLKGSRVREREFLMSIGHDLKTPLTTIRGYAEALDDGAVDEEQLPSVAESLHRQTDQLSRLVEDVMLLARIEANEFSLRPEEVDVAPLVAGTVDGWRIRCEADNIDLHTVVDAHCGTATIDPDRFVQVLGNLMDNALRYTPTGGWIRVKAEGHGESIGISVANDGPAISHEDLAHVFDRLYVAERYRAARPSGSGLGLSIVHELVHAMGGRIRAESQPELGTVFIIDFDRQHPSSQ